MGNSKESPLGNVNHFCARLFAPSTGQPHIVAGIKHKRSILDSNITYNLKALKEYIFLLFSTSRHGTSSKRRFIIFKSAQRQGLLLANPPAGVEGDVAWSLAPELGKTQSSWHSCRVG